MLNVRGRFCALVLHLVAVFTLLSTTVRSASSFVYVVGTTPFSGCVGRCSKDLVIVDAETGLVVLSQRVADEDGTPAGVAMTPDGSRLFVSTLAAPGLLYTFDLTTHQGPGVLPLEPGVGGALAVSSDSRRLFMLHNPL